jgi:hypothetical protein
MSSITANNLHLNPNSLRNYSVSTMITTGEKGSTSALAMELIFVQSSPNNPSSSAPLANPSSANNWDLPPSAVQGDEQEQVQSSDNNNIIDAIANANASSIFLPNQQEGINTDALLNAIRDPLEVKLEALEREVENYVYTNQALQTQLQTKHQSNLDLSKQVKLKEDKIKALEQENQLMRRHVSQTRDYDIKAAQLTEVLPKYHAVFNELKRYTDSIPNELIINSSLFHKDNNLSNNNKYRKANHSQKHNNNGVRAEGESSPVIMSANTYSTISARMKQSMKQLGAVESKEPINLADNRAEGEEEAMPLIDTNIAPSLDNSHSSVDTFYSHHGPHVKNDQTLLNALDNRSDRPFCSTTIAFSATTGRNHNTTCLSLDESAALGFSLPMVDTEEDHFQTQLQQNYMIPEYSDSESDSNSNYNASRRAQLKPGVQKSPKPILKRRNFSLSYTNEQSDDGENADSHTSEEERPRKSPRLRKSVTRYGYEQEKQLKSGGNNNSSNNTDNNINNKSEPLSRMPLRRSVGTPQCGLSSEDEPSLSRSRLSQAKKRVRIDTHRNQTQYIPPRSSRRQIEGENSDQEQETSLYALQLRELTRSSSAVQFHSAFRQAIEQGPLNVKTFAQLIIRTISSFARFMPEDRRNENNVKGRIARMLDQISAGPQLIQQRGGKIAETSTSPARARANLKSLDPLGAVNQAGNVVHVLLRIISHPQYKHDSSVLLAALEALRDVMYYVDENSRYSVNYSELMQVLLPIIRNRAYLRSDKPLNILAFSFQSIWHLIRFWDENEQLPSNPPAKEILTELSLFLEAVEQLPDNQDRKVYLMAYALQDISIYAVSDYEKLLSIIDCNRILNIMQSMTMKDNRTKALEIWEFEVFSHSAILLSYLSYSKTARAQLVRHAGYFLSMLQKRFCQQKIILERFLTIWENLGINLDDESSGAELRKYRSEANLTVLKIMERRITDAIVVENCMRCFLNWQLQEARLPLQLYIDAILLHFNNRYISSCATFYFAELTDKFHFETLLFNLKESMNSDESFFVNLMDRHSKEESSDPENLQMEIHQNSIITLSKMMNFGLISPRNYINIMKAILNALKMFRDSCPEVADINGYGLELISALCRCNSNPLFISALANHKFIFDDMKNALKLYHHKLDLKVDILNIIHHAIDEPNFKQYFLQDKGLNIQIIAISKDNSVYEQLDAQLQRFLNSITGVNRPTANHNNSSTSRGKSSSIPSSLTDNHTKADSSETVGNAMSANSLMSIAPSIIPHNVPQLAPAPQIQVNCNGSGEESKSSSPALRSSVVSNPAVLSGCHGYSALSRPPNRFSKGAVAEAETAAEETEAMKLAEGEAKKTESKKETVMDLNPADFSKSAVSPSDPFKSNATEINVMADSG